jgi:hypothetical protein
VFGIGAAVDIVEQERRQDALCGGAIVAGGGNNHLCSPWNFHCGHRQTGNSRLAGLVFIKSFNRGVDKAQCAIIACARLGITGQNGVHDRLVLFGQAGKHRRHQIHALAALLDGGLQQVEKPRMVCSSTTLCEASAIAR